jgi:hypothetical protein
MASFDQLDRKWMAALKNVDKAAAKVWREERPGEMNIAESIASESGLLGSSEGPQDALRHIIGTGLLVDRFGSVPVMVGEVLYEGVSFNEDNESRRNDFHNNKISRFLWSKYKTLDKVIVAGLKIIAKGRFDGGPEERARATGAEGEENLRAAWKETKWDATLDKQVERALERHDRGVGKPEEKLDKGADSNEEAAEQVRREKEAQEAIEAALRATREEDERRRSEQEKEKDKNAVPVEVPKTRPAPDDGDDTFPATLEELRQAMIEAGVATERFDQILNDANLTEDDLAPLIQELQDRSMTEVIMIGALAVDTPEDAKRTLSDWMRKRFRGWQKGKVGDEVTDPPRDADLEKLLDIVRLSDRKP